MKVRGFLLLLVLTGACWPFPAVRAESAVTEVVVLGVDHTAQLVNPRQQPAAMRAFFASIAPAAICIERSPDRVARNDHYEFTYEIQNVIAPWARENRIALCPFDWLPDPEDSALAFGIDDLERPPLLRRPSGFQGFLTFPEPSSRTAGLFFADAGEERARHRSFYVNYPEQPHRDFARRLFLYRTFMQASRIGRAARSYAGQRLLVVVGVMHKDDIERILAAQAGIRIVQPSAIAAEPSAADIARHQRAEDLFAIVTFNVLGVESASELLDLAWMQAIVRELERKHPGPETELLSTRLAQLQGRIRPGEALKRYERIANAAGDRRFTWTGVKDASRLDSFVDPFGNLTIAQRARLELARLHHHAGRPAHADAIRGALRAELATPLKQAQLDGYWPAYVATSVRDKDRE